jgi:hypothetical protein
VTSICGTCFNGRGDPARSRWRSSRYSCPYCKSVVIDMARTSLGRDTDIAEAISKPYPCLRAAGPFCLHENVSCSSRGQASAQCSRDPRRRPGLVLVRASRPQFSPGSRASRTLEAFERAMR